MVKDIPHLGIYKWFDADGTQRPMPGSVEGDRRAAAHEEYLKKAKETPEYAAWVKKHGFSK
jgi:hypothetical protein